jgi:hypothetical protein
MEAPYYTMPRVLIASRMGEGGGARLLSRVANAPKSLLISARVYGPGCQSSRLISLGSANPAPSSEESAANSVPASLSSPAQLDARAMARAPDGPSDRRARLESCRCGIGGWLVCPPHIPPGGAELCGRRADAVRQELTARPIVAWWTRRSPFAQTPSTNSQRTAIRPSDHTTDRRVA